MRKNKEDADTIFVRFVELGEEVMESVTPDVEDAMPLDVE